MRLNSLIESMFTKSGISSKIDDSGQTIGKRYARTDECGIPFAITVDFDTLKAETVTLRDLHTMK
jgi:glycyl-tRNA synthetase